MNNYFCNTTPFNVVQYDTSRTLNYVLSTGGSAVDVTDATVVLRIKDNISGSYVDRAPTVDVAASGSLHYDLVAGDVLTPGMRWLQFIVTFDDDTVLNIPTVGYLQMRVWPQLI